MFINVRTLGELEQSVDMAKKEMDKLIKEIELLGLEEKISPAQLRVRLNNIQVLLNKVHGITSQFGVKIVLKIGE